MNILISVDPSADEFNDDIVDFLKTRGLDVTATTMGGLHVLNCCKTAVAEPSVEVPSSDGAAVLPMTDISPMMSEPMGDPVGIPPNIPASPSGEVALPAPAEVAPEIDLNVPTPAPEQAAEDLGETTIFSLSLTQPVRTVKDSSCQFSKLTATNVLYDPASHTVSFDYQGFRFNMIIGEATDVVNPDHPVGDTTIRALMLLPGGVRPIPCLIDVEQVTGEGNCLHVGQDLMNHLGGTDVSGK